MSKFNVELDEWNLFTFAVFKVYNKRTKLGNNSASFKEFPNGIKVSYRHFGSAFCFLVTLCSLTFRDRFRSKNFRFRSHVYLRLIVLAILLL